MTTATGLSQLDLLEAEGIHVMREVAAEFERPALLFSGGKDSIVMLHLAQKAFWPARLPFPLVHVDTGHNFPEVLAYRDRRAAELATRSPEIVCTGPGGWRSPPRLVEDGSGAPKTPADEKLAQRSGSSPLRNGSFPLPAHREEPCSQPPLGRPTFHVRRRWFSSRCRGRISTPRPSSSES